MNDLTSQWKSSQKNDKFCLQSLGLWSFTIVYYENNSTKNKDIFHLVKARISYDHENYPWSSIWTSERTYYYEGLHSTAENSGHLGVCTAQQRTLDIYR